MIDPHSAWWRSAEFQPRMDTNADESRKSNCFNFSGFCSEDAARTASRSDAARVAVGFSPRDEAGNGRVAERRMKRSASISSVAPRHGHVAGVFRGLKPTATFSASLRDSFVRQLLL